MNSVEEKRQQYYNKLNLYLQSLQQLKIDIETYEINKMFKHMNVSQKLTKINDELYDINKKLQCLYLEK